LTGSVLAKVRDAVREPVANRIDGPNKRQKIENDPRWGGIYGGEHERSKEEERESAQLANCCRLLILTPILQRRGEGQSVGEGTS